MIFKEINLSYVHKLLAKTKNRLAVVMTIISVIIAPPIHAANFSGEKHVNYNFLNPLDDLSHSYWKGRGAVALKDFLIQEQKIVNDKEIDRARSLAKHGAKQLDKGERQLGLENLNQAWQINKNQASVGIMIAISHLKSNEYEQVIKICNELIVSHPMLPDGYILKGLAYANINKVNQAIEAFELLLKKVPGEPEGSYNLANLFANMGSIKKARALFESALANNPMYYRLMYGLAKLENIEGHHKKAENLMLKAIAAYPDSPEPYVVLANFYSANGDYGKVQKLLEPVTTKFSKNEQIVVLLGWVYLHANLDLKAEALLQKYLTQNPNRAEAHYNLALVLEKSKRYNDALRHLSKTLEVDRENQRAKFLQVWIYLKMNKNKQASNVLNQLFLKNPDDPKVLGLMAKVALAENQPAKAISLLKKAKKKQGTNLFSVQLAVAYVRNGDQQAAFKELNDWVKKHPSDIFTLNALADLALESGKVDMALQQYYLIIKINPDYSSAYNNIAFLLLKKGDIGQALQHSEQAYQLDAENPNILDTLALIKLSMGKTKEAIGLFGQALQLKPNDSAISLNLAKALIKDGDTQRAKGIVNQIISTNANFSKKHKLSELLSSIK